MKGNKKILKRKSLQYFHSPSRGKLRVNKVGHDTKEIASYDDESFDPPKRKCSYKKNTDCTSLSTSPSSSETIKETGEIEDRHDTKDIVHVTLKDESYSTIYNKKFANREIVKYKCVDFQSFSNWHCEWLHDWCDAQGWIWLLSKPFKVYPNLVKEFYTHMDTSGLESGVIRSWVRGKVINLTPGLLGEILHLPADGIYDYPSMRWSNHDQFNLSKCMQLLLGDPSVTGRTKKPNVWELEYDMRLLHLILTNTFVPRNGNKASMTYVDMFVMYCIANKIRLNMPLFILRYMKTIVGQNKLGLGYAMWLTLVFEKFEVDVSCEPCVETSRENKCVSKYKFDIKTLENHMKYKLEDKRWVKGEGSDRGQKGYLPITNDDDDDIIRPCTMLGKDTTRITEDCKLMRATFTSCLEVKKMLALLYPDRFSVSQMNKLKSDAEREVQSLLGETYLEPDNSIDDGVNDYDDDDRLLPPQNPRHEGFVTDSNGSVEESDAD